MNRHLRDIHGKDKYLNDIGIVSNHVPITGQIIDLTDTKHEDDKELPPYHHDTLEQSKMVYCQPSLLEPISTLIEHLNEETTSHSSHGMKRKIQGSEAFDFPPTKYQMSEEDVAMLQQALCSDEDA